MRYTEPIKAREAKMTVPRLYQALFIVKHIVLFAVITYFMAMLTGCGGKADVAETDTAAVKPSAAFYIAPEADTVHGHRVFIKRPATVIPGPVKWVWYAPTFLDDTSFGPTPMKEQVGWYFDQLSAAGIAVVGMDIGESFGSPQGRDLFEAFYQKLQTMGFAAQGCMVLQSRGGLMGYNWMMDYPGRVNCVAGIYPLTTVQDYVGLDYMANIWGVDSNWLKANLTTQSPLERKQALAGVNVLHLHGNADTTVHANIDQDFVTALASGQLVIIPGLGHEFNAPEFFQNQGLIDFLIANLH